MSLASRKVQIKQSVYRLCVLARRLAKPLGRSARRRAKHHLSALLFEQRYYAIYDSRLARTGSACNYVDAVLDAILDGVYLRFVQVDAL